MQADWELSQFLTSDGHGIRCTGAVTIVNTPKDAGNDDDNNNDITTNTTSSSTSSTWLMAGSQGGTLTRFLLNNDTNQSSTTLLLPYQHDHAVTALVTVPSRNLLVTGCKDHLVRLFALHPPPKDDSGSSTSQVAGDAEPDESKDTTNCGCTLVQELSGHEKPVTSLDVLNDEYLLSGSWDGTCKIWNLNNHSLLATLENHENSVCVCGLGQTKDGLLTVATGSAGQAVNNSVRGQTVRLWTVNVATGDVQLQHSVANDHEGPIRDICCIRQSDNSNNNNSVGVLATCSNDGTVKLRDSSTGVCFSTLMPFIHQPHPPMLLSLCVGPDFVATAAEDGHVVVWNLDNNDNTHAVIAAEPQILRHAECVWHVTALPNGDLVTACQDGMVRIWTRDSTRQAPLAEREAFHAQVEEKLRATQNGPTPDEIRQLPVWELRSERRGTSEGQVQLFQKEGIAIAAQWSAAAQTWIEVGQVTGQVADSSSGAGAAGTIDGVHYDFVFPIEVDLAGGGVANLQIGYNTGENPFSAAQRFIDAHMLPQHHLAEIADYIRQRAGQPPPMLGLSAVAVTGTPIVTFTYLPARGYKSFDLPAKDAATTLDKMKLKLQEFGVTDETTIQSIGSLIATLAASNRYHASQVSDAELRVLAQLLQTMDAAQTFPVLDLVRLTVLHPDAASSGRAHYWKGVIAQAVTLCSSTTTLSGPAVVALPMLSLRLFGNALKGGPGAREAVAAQLEDVLQCASQYVQSTNKNIRLSVATVLYNTALYWHEQKSNVSSSNNGSHFAARLVVPLLHEILTHKAYEAEALFRCLVALGTLALDWPEAKQAAQVLYLASKVEPAASPHTDACKTAAKEVYSVLQS